MQCTGLEFVHHRANFRASASFAWHGTLSVGFLRDAMLTLERIKQRIIIVIADARTPIHTLLSLPALRNLHTQLLQRK
jgi:hypothetical protein